MRYRILDLETVPHPDVNNWLEPCDPDPKLLEPAKPDSRLKNPELVAANRAEVERLNAERPALIEASIKERTEERNAKCSLDPDCNRIVALGWHDVGFGDPHAAICKNEDEEAAALEFFWKTYAQQYTKLVTFNGARFDLPVLVMRSIYLEVDHPEIVIAPAWKSPHVDLWERLSLGGARDRKDVHSLAFYARRFGIGTLDKVDGSEIAQLAKDGKWDLIRDHCLSDIGLTHALANRLKLLKLTADEAPAVAGVF